MTKYNMSETKKNSQIIFLFGPTGVGKTALLSEFFSSGYEVINADSVQVYRRLDIGSAKPEPEILNTVPHHLIDILDAHEQFTLGDFIKRSHTLIDEITSRGSLPVVSGGTAFYFKHLLFGMPEAPPSDEGVRATLAAEARERGMEALFSELERVDALSAKRINPADSYRILRALEVYRSSGRPLSSYQMVASTEPEIAPLIIGLHRDREELYGRIDRRVDLMFEQGLIEEMQSLISSGFKPDWPGMRGIGYREFFIARECGEFSVRNIADRIKQHSRRYAKRQMTFFRSLPNVHWIHPDDTDRITELLHSRSL